MKERLRRLGDTRGVTLIELVFAIFVMSIILVSVTAIFAPMLRFYERANNFAEANTLLDNLSNLIMDNIASATEITIDSNPSTKSFTVRAQHEITYEVNDDGILVWTGSSGLSIPVLPRDYYKVGRAGTVFTVDVDCDADASGLVTITLTLISADGWSVDRSYVSKPVGLKLIDKGAGPIIVG